MHDDVLVAASVGSRDCQNRLPPRSCHRTSVRILRHAAGPLVGRLPVPQLPSCRTASSAA